MDQSLQRPILTGFGIFLAFVSSPLVNQQSAFTDGEEAALPFRPALSSS
jgi:hypothetical protein